MKFFVAFALIATVASAAVLPFSPAQMSELQQIVDAIYSPSTDPATSAALEQMLAEYLQVAGVPSIGSPILAPHPTIPEPAPIPSPIINPIPAPVVDEPASVASAGPLVQIVLNINNQAEVAVAPTPAVDAVHVVAPEFPVPVAPVQIASPEFPVPVAPVQIASPTFPVPVAPVQIATPEFPVAPVQIATPEFPVAPVQIAAPSFPVPSPIVNLPEILN